MRWLILFFLATSTLAAADPFQSHIRPTEPLTPQQQQATFTLPPGFEIQLFAAEPDIQKPLNMAFDTRGRLWVTGTVEYPYPAKEGEGRDAIRILADTNGDGRADKITTFVDGLNIPMGLYPYKNGVVVYNMPNIWYFVDTDGDDRADERHVLYGSLGMPHDTHGMQNAFRRGYDGWLYICHGFANTSTIRGRDGSEVTMHSGNTYRVRLDGSRVEQVTWGQVNPFGMTFLPDGDIITADCHSKPLTLLLSGGHYSSFGKPHDGLGFAPNLMEHSHGSTAISGVAVITGESFPSGMNGNLLVGNVVTCRVHRDKLVYHGSTPKAIEQPDFVTTTDPWFRPVDLQFGPDGALYIADFYNRIIGHYEVPLDHPQRDRHRGRIWRVVYRGTTDPARTAPTAMDMLTDDVFDAGLDDNNLTRRMLVTDRLSDQEHIDASRLRRDVRSADTLSVSRAIHSLWVLQRTGRLSIADLHPLAKSPDPIARVHALHAAGELSTWGQPARSLVLEKLRDKDAHVRRAAVQALAKHPHITSLRSLVKMLSATGPDDQLLVHALRIALRNHLRDEPLAIDFLDSKPTPDERGILASIALAVPSATAGEFLASTLAAAEAAIPPSLMPAALRHAVRYAPVTETESVLEIARRRTDGDIDLQVELVQAIEEGYRKRDAMPADGVVRWADELIQQVISTPLLNEQAEGLSAVFSLAARFRLTQFADDARKTLLDESSSWSLRAAAASSFVTLSAPAQDNNAIWTSVASLLEQEKLPAALRTEICQCIAAKETLKIASLAERVMKTSSAHGQRLFADQLLNSADGAALLFELIEKGQASARLLRYETVRDRLSAAQIPDLTTRLEAVMASAPNEKDLSRLRDTIADGLRAGKGNVDQGQQVFTKHCGTCHQVAGHGPLIGPQLDGIGNRGLERVIEDVLDPNRNVDQLFRTVLLALADGRIISGLERREDESSVILVDKEAQERTVAVRDIEERQQSSTSLMPSDFDAVLKPEELTALVSYLLSLAN